MQKQEEDNAIETKLKPDEACKSESKKTAVRKMHTPSKKQRKCSHFRSLERR